jgi:hypothetical protein
MRVAEKARLQGAAARAVHVFIATAVLAAQGLYRPQAGRRAQGTPL